MGISGPIQQQGVRYYNNWQLLWFLKGPKVAIWEMTIEQEGGQGRLCVAGPAPQRSPTSALHAQRRTRRPSTLAKSQDGFGSLKEEKIKAHGATTGGTAAPRSALALAHLLEGSSPPSPQAARCRMKEQRCCQRSFRIDFPCNGRMTSAQRIPRARTSNWQLP